MRTFEMGVEYTRGTREFPSVMMTRPGATVREFV